ncbi:MAG: hypothetical protein LBT89_12680 [Planctomycetaceae bacterium]|nr:hypothetical protein [Planctomycetaceae bacterium]
MKYYFLALIVTLSFAAGGMLTAQEPAVPLPSQLTVPQPAAPVPQPVVPVPQPAAPVPAESPLLSVLLGVGLGCVILLVLYFLFVYKKSDKQNDEQFEKMLLNTITNHLKPKFPGGDLRQVIADIIKNGRPAPKELENLLSIRYSIEKLTGHFKLSVMITTKIDSNKATVTTSENELDWVEIPSSIRYSFIKNQETILTYSLYEQIPFTNNKER